MKKQKETDDIILININVDSNEKADEIVAFLKKVLKKFPEVDIESIESNQSAWVIDGG